MRLLFSISMALILFCAPNTAVADDAKAHYEERFSEANGLYKSEQYQDALIIYQEIQSTGYSSPALFFNMGNTHHKLGQLGQSILYFEKARKLAPTDADIRFNLEMVNRSIADKNEALPELFYQIWWKHFLNMASVDGWAWISIMLTLIAATAFIGFVLSISEAKRRLIFVSGIGFTVLAALAFGCASALESQLEGHTEAIVMAPSLTGTSAPDQNASELFIVHEGTKVELIEQDGSWQKVSLANGSVGWVPFSQLAPI